MRNEKITKAVELFHCNNDVKGLADKTQKYYREFLQVFIKWLPRNITACKQLNEELLEKYILYLKHKIENKISINSYARAVRRFCYFCMEKKLCKYFKVQLVKQPSKIKPTFEQQDIKTILANLNFGKQSTICYLLLSTGIRSATVCNLKVADFSFDENLIFLNVVKNKKPYAIPITQELATHMKNYIRFQRLKSDGFLFLNSHGKQYDDHTLYKSMKKYLLSINVKKYGIHIFRHTFAKLITKNGCDAITLMHWLGHSSIEQSKNYVNLYGNELRTSLERHNPLKNFA